MNPDSALVQQQPAGAIPSHAEPTLLDAGWSSRSAEELRVIVEHGLRDDRFGAAAHVLSAYLGSDIPVAVSDYTRRLIIESAEAIDARHGTHFAAQCTERVAISYPAIDTTEFLDPDPTEVEARLARRGLAAGEYVLFLSRLAHAKGVDDLIAGFAASRACDGLRLVVAGNGPEAGFLRDVAAASSALLCPPGHH